MSTSWIKGCEGCVQVGVRGAILFVISFSVLLLLVVGEGGVGRLETGGGGGLIDCGVS